MGREIKFRAWDKDEKVMRDWAYLINDVHYGPNRLIDKETDDNIFNDPDFILMQYTGLKDCRGVEIYEGDIVTVDGSRETIAWDDGTGFYPFTQPAYGGYEWESASCKPEDIEVLGNVHESPSLLE